MSKLNIGVVGLGHMGLLHLRICLCKDDVNVIGVADKSERALKKAELSGIKYLYNDYKELFNQKQKLDAVIISLPNFLHFDSVKSALESGINVFIEKPMATTIEECEALVDLADKTKLKLMVGHSMRFIDAIDKMKISTEKGHIGKLEIITLESIQNGPLSHGVVPSPVSEWWFNPKKSGGGALLDLGYHLIDLFHFFTKERSEVLYAYLDHKYNLEVEDGATIILKTLETDTRGVINVGWFEKTIFPKFNFRLILHGNAGYLSTDDYIPKNPQKYALKEGVKNFIRKITGQKIHYLSYSYYYDSYYKELTHFFECIKNNKQPSVSSIDGLKAMKTINSAYLKSKESN